MDLESAQNNALAKLLATSKARLIMAHMETKEYESYIQLQDLCSLEDLENVAFVSTPSNTNDVNTSNVHVSTASSSLSTASTTDIKLDLSDAQSILSTQSTKWVSESSSKAMLAIDGVGFDWSFMTEEKYPFTNFVVMAISDSEPTLKRGLASVEEQLVFYKKNEVIFTDQIVVLKRDASFNELEINALKILIERLKKEKELKIPLDEIKENIWCPISEDWVLIVNRDVTFGKRSFNHLIKDCDFHDNKMVQKPVLNNVKKGTGQREVRPVWNNAMRTNHQNFSNSRRNFAPTTVLTKSGLVPISTARQSSSRAATSISTARPIKTAAPKTFVNVAKTRPNAFLKSHSPSRRPFYQQTALKNRNLNNKVNIVKVNSVNTAKGKMVTSVVGEQWIDVVKSKACWVWRPKLKVLDHVSKNSGSYICLELKFYLINKGYADLMKMLVLSHRLSRRLGGMLHMTNVVKYIGKSMRSELGSGKVQENHIGDIDAKTSFEADLKSWAQTKQNYSTALTKLIKNVKKLEQTVKTSQSRRRTRVVLSDEEEVSEDPSNQGRSLIKELDLDAEIFLVHSHDAEIQEKISDDTEVLLEEEESTELVEEPTELVEDQGSGEKGEQEVTTADTALNTASVPISTTSATPEVSTAAANLVYIRRSAEKRKDKGKAIMIEDESVQKKSKKQLEQERLSHEEAIRLQEQVDEEERKRIARDAEIAKQLQEEYDKARKKEAVAEVDTAHVIDWNVIRVRDVTVAYQSFEDMVKGFDREDLVALWSLVKERFRSAESTEDMEKALWVELKRLFEPDKDDVLWKLQRYMHDPLTWRLYGSCGVHHISSTRGHDIYMLTVKKKDYPLSTAVMGLMLGRRLQVEEDSEVARDLVMKIFIEANKPRS
ncbi:hypothetical protein Tco_0577629 [Tanacetum coccineum]